VTPVDQLDAPTHEPKPAHERTRADNEAAKAWALALALWRRQLGLRDIAHLPETTPKGQRGTLTLAGFARVAYREATDLPAFRLLWGDPPTQPPSSRNSPSWAQVPAAIAVIARLAEHPDPAHPSSGHIPARDLIDGPMWRNPACTTKTTSPAPEAAATTSTTTTSTAAAGLPSAPSASSVTPSAAPTASTTAAPAAGDPELTALRYSRSLGDCGSCGHPVRWVDGPEGVVSLHREPTPDGGWVVDEVALRGRPLADGEPADRPQFVPHSPRCGKRPRSRAEAFLDLGLVLCAYCGLPMENVALHPLNGQDPDYDIHPDCSEVRHLTGRQVFVLERPRRARRNGGTATRPTTTYRR
jgi:hypothetical protein